MTDEQALREALSRRYFVEVRYADGGSEEISFALPLWGCFNWATDCAVAWGRKNRDTFYIITQDGNPVMKLAWHNDIQGYQWSVVDAS